MEGLFVNGTLTKSKFISINFIEKGLNWEILQL